MSRRHAENIRNISNKSRILEVLSRQCICLKRSHRWKYKDDLLEQAMIEGDTSITGTMAKERLNARGAGWWYIFLLRKSELNIESVRWDGVRSAPRDVGRFFLIARDLLLGSQKQYIPQSHSSKGQAFPKAGAVKSADFWLHILRVECCLLRP